MGYQSRDGRAVPTENMRASWCTGDEIHDRNGWWRIGLPQRSRTKKLGRLKRVIDIQNTHTRSVESSYPTHVIVGLLASYISQRYHGCVCASV